VLTDILFTSTTAIVQPDTENPLARPIGWPMLEGWVGLSLVLHANVGVLWLPVVGMQSRMRDLAIAARDSGNPLRDSHHWLYRRWCACGFPACAGVLGINWLMPTKPTFG